MNIILLVIIIAFQGILSIQDMKDARKYINVEITEDFRVKYYKECIVYGWIPTVVVALFILFTSISLSDIGFRMVNLNSITWLTVLTFVITGIILLILIYQVIMFFKSENYRAQVKEQIEKEGQSENYYNAVVAKILTPRTKREKSWFLFVSLTAGICEEFVWRGCLLFLLQDVFPMLTIFTTGIISCVLFGLFHCYQGIKGTIKTGLIAAIFVLLYFVTDSIFPGILLHFLFDFSSAFILKENSK